MISGMMLGLVGVLALLAAAVVLAVINRRERSGFLSRMVILLFLLAFVGGVAVALVGGLRPREGRPGTIGTVDRRELAALEARVAADPTDLRARERLGHLYLQQQEFEKVFQLAHEALQLDPRSVESRTHMGMVLFALKEFDQAIAQFDKALALNPSDLETLMFKGIVQFQGRQDAQGARETWERYLKVAKPSDIGYERVRMFLGSIDSAVPGG